MFGHKIATRSSKNQTAIINQAGGANTKQVLVVEPKTQQNQHGISGQIYDNGSAQSESAAHAGKNGQIVVNLMQANSVGQEDIQQMDAQQKQLTELMVEPFVEVVNRKKVVHKGRNSYEQNGQYIAGRNGQNAGGESVQENRDELEYPFVEVASKKKGMNKSNGHV
ncbi:Hypothetical predicted protein [Olea europaea subsp. europaea]|uniref:Uncharacterized protein n=1 Tax=Olea europaea subsp. europaea TaxID=158383 RepID=A0A8S0QI93_OLEEU|nr:Hypothetical predicted protein [Olea europaea subsp. europaea]